MANAAAPASVPPPPAPPVAGSSGAGSGNSGAGKAPKTQNAAAAQAGSKNAAAAAPAAAQTAAATTTATAGAVNAGTGSVRFKLEGNITLDDFELGVTLGTGSFGRVRFAAHKSTNTIWAIKMLKKAEVIRLQQVEHMISEKTILQTLDHPFIVSLGAIFQDVKYLYMVLEYIVGGEFFTHLRKAGQFDATASRFYAGQITTVFEYMHALDLIYRDLKPENLLLDQQGYLKITDFGFAKRVAFKTYTLCGTPEYIAPEVLLNKGHGKGVDWWTLGILLFEMLAGQPPFVDDDPMGIYQQVLAGKVTFPRQFDRNAKSLIKKLLVADLTKRYGCLKNGAEDVKKHKFFTGFEWDRLLARQLPAPIIPTVSSPSDTSNFDPYPDSVEEAQVPVFNGKDPFADF